MHRHVHKSKSGIWECHQIQSKSDLIFHYILFIYCQKDKYSFCHNIMLSYDMEIDVLYHTGVSYHKVCVSSYP